MKSDGQSNRSLWDLLHRGFMLDVFIHDLIESGRVTVPLAPENASHSSADVRAMIRRLYDESRMELAFPPPGLSMDAAVWALEFIENACRFLVYRELDEAIIADRLCMNCPGKRSVDRSHSVDLLMRYLPDLTRMATGVGEQDPLVKHLHDAAASWPLSSVGIPNITCDADELALILADPCLGQLYVDRIVQRTDLSRLEPRAIRDAITAALGAHASLAPQMAAAIRNYQEQI